MTTTKSTSPDEGVAQKAQDVMATVQETAQVQVSELKGQAASTIRQQVDRRSTQAGEQLRAIGSALRTGADQLEREGKTTTAHGAHQAAEQSERLGNYLGEASLDELLDDVESLARSRPWLTASTGIVVGFVASRFLKASAERRYRPGRDLGKRRPGAGHPTPELVEGGGQWP